MYVGCGRGRGRKLWGAGREGERQVLVGGWVDWLVGGWLVRWWG